MIKFLHLTLCWLTGCFCLSLVPTALAMHRADNSKYFMFIEPDATQKSTEPVDDALTLSLQLAMEQAVTGTSSYTDLNDAGSFKTEASYRGMHFCEDGAVSDVHDYLLPNGFITNSLATHYARYYRSVLPSTELKKLQDLHQFMQDRRRKNKTNKEEEL